ncbi:MAG: hypothetical protein VB071_14855 [Lawsonibacter sp.]|nr:hypothetical protein [Lawsonibacter sp.]
MNTTDDAASMEVCRQLSCAFGFETKEGNSSNFASTSVEVTKSMYPGKSGYIAVRTNNISLAVAELAKHGFAVHLLQK